MSVQTYRLKIEASLRELNAIKDMISSSGKFAEEAVRVTEMIVALVAFSSLRDEGIQEESVYIERILHAINQYVEFMKTSI